jgi:hypothetical protein
MYAVYTNITFTSENFSPRTINGSAQDSKTKIGKFSFAGNYYVNSLT